VFDAVVWMQGLWASRHAVCISLLSFCIVLEATKEILRPDYGISAYDLIEQPREELHRAADELIFCNRMLWKESRGSEERY
jgi:hypothetical protein